MTAQDTRHGVLSNVSGNDQKWRSVTSKRHPLRHRLRIPQRFQLASESFASPRAPTVSSSSPKASSEFPSLPIPPLAPQLSHASTSSVDSESAATPHPPSLDEMIRRHALGSRAYRLNVSFADGLAHLETDENEALLTSIRKSATALDERFLPVFDDFSNVVTKVDLSHGVGRTNDDQIASRYSSIPHFIVRFLVF